MYLVYILLGVRLLKGAIAIEQDNLCSKWKTEGQDTDPTE